MKKLESREDIEKLVNLFYGKVQNDDMIGFFFNEQKFAVTLDDGSNGDMGFPDHEKSLGVKARRLFYRQAGGEIG